MSLREAKRTSTRTAIVQAAWSLAESRPWSEITIDDVAAGAGVARRTFFNYFESKDQLLGTLGGWHPGALLAAFRVRPESEDPWSSLQSALLAVLAESPREAIERMRAMWREPALSEQNVAGRRLVEQGVVDEIRRRRPELSGLAALLLSAVFITTSRAALQNWVDEGEVGDLVDVVAAALDSVRVTTPTAVSTGVIAAPVE